MNLAPIESRLVASKPAGVRKVGSAADLAAIKAGRTVTPAIYLLPLDELATGMGFSGEALSRVTAGFALVFAVANKSDAAGGAAVGDLEVLRDAVKALLHGWIPAVDYERIAFSRGRLLSLDDGVVFWMDEYATAYFSQ